MVSEIVGRDRSPKVVALMMGDWSKDIWTSALSEMGQASQSHPSPLSGLTHPTHS